MPVSVTLPGRRLSVVPALTWLPVPSTNASAVPVAPARSTTWPVDWMRPAGEGTLMPPLSMMRMPAPPALRDSPVTVTAPPPVLVICAWLPSHTPSPPVAAPPPSRRPVTAMLPPPVSTIGSEVAPPNCAPMATPWPGALPLLATKLPTPVMRTAPLVVWMPAAAVLAAICTPVPRLLVPTMSTLPLAVAMRVLSRLTAAVMKLPVDTALLRPVSCTLPPAPASLPPL